MKKTMIAFVLGCILALALVTTVLADNGPHGSFTSTTDACANCHRMHSASYGSNGLLTADPETLCLSCHDGTGAGTNVEHGVYSQAGSDAFTGAAGSVIEGIDGQSLFAGGFNFALMNTAWDGTSSFDAANAPASRATTSMHDLGTSGSVWGSGANNSVAGTYVLDCTSCHDPHGNAGWDTTTTPDTKVASYRLLRWQPSGSSGFTAPASSVNWSGGAFPLNDATTPVSGWLVPDNYLVNGTEWYTINSDPTYFAFAVDTTGRSVPFALGDYGMYVNTIYRAAAVLGAPMRAFDYVPAAINTGFFCAQCHDRYFNNSRLRNNTDDSVYCGHPNNGTTVVGTATLPYLPDADGVAPFIHPVDPANCQPVVTAGVLTAWDDNAPSGDSFYMYRHASGDVRASMDLTVTQGGTAFTSAGRTCLSCHVAHGTAAQMTATAAAAAPLTNNSVLLRLDNRAMCLRCHAGNVNYTVAP